MKPGQWVEPATAEQAPNIRIIFLDALRGVAVLGIYWINIAIFMLDSDIYDYTYSSINVLSADVLSGPVSNVLVEGTMRGLFSILFGASAMVFLNEAKLATQGLAIVDRYYRRTLLLVLFGLIHGYLLLWPNDVLYIYGIFGMFLFPLRKISAKYLLLIGIILLTLGDINLTSSPADTSTESAEAVADISSIEETTGQEIATQMQVPSTGDNAASTDASSAEMSHFQHRGYIQLFKENITNVIDQQSNKLYTTFVFDVGGMMIVGMALLKLGILTGARSRRFYLLLMLSGYLAGILARDSNFFSYLFSADGMISDTDDALLGYNLGRLLVIMGHIGLVALLVSYRPLDFVTRLFVNTGRMALTNYILQTVISLFIFHVYEVELLSGFDRANLVYICLLVWGFQIALSTLWLEFFKFGPLEWLWRSLIYGQKQPIKRSADVVQA